MSQVWRTTIIPWCRAIRLSVTENVQTRDFFPSWMECIMCIAITTVASEAVYSCVSKKKATWCFVITLANVDRFSKFFYEFIREKILYVHTTKISTSPAVYCYTTLWNSKIQKNVTEFFWRWTWQLICFTRIYCEILRNLPQKYCAIDFT